MKDRTIQALKGLAIIGVVFHHIVNRRLDSQAGDWMRNIALLFDWCVLAFFCASGYLQALSDSKKKRSIWEFTRVRFNRLIIPYVLLFVFYSCIWQALQALHLPNIGVKIPPDFIGKLREMLCPVDSQVAQQLYFFPLLFGVSITLMIIHRGLGLYGTWAALLITATIGMKYGSVYFTGFSWEVFLWGICFYASGYLLFHYRAKKSAIRIALVVFTLILIIFNGYSGIIRCIPLWLISEGSIMGINQVPLLGRLGDASGTIYIYHTPFIIQPMVILATYLPGPLAQFLGIILAAAIAIAVCCYIYEHLQNTRAKILLM